jgi:hypothetical protein
MEKHLLSKSTFIRGTQCLKSLYLNKKRPFLRDRLAPEQLAKFRRGTKLGIVAQRLFPGGIDVRPRSYHQYTKKLLETQEVINSQTHDVIYEAGFQYDKLLVFLDILSKEEGKWIGYEVKSALTISDTFMLDAAFQYYVITNAGLPLDDFQIIYINRAYQFDGTLNLKELFIKESVLDRILPLQSFIKEKVKEEKATLLLDKSPLIEPGEQCINPYPCDFIGHCWKKIPKEQWPKISYSSEEFYHFVDDVLKLATEENNPNKTN